MWDLATNARALAAYQLSLGAALVAALLNAAFGSLLAWVLVRYRFPGRRLLDGLVDFPFALPTAVAGLTLANLFSDRRLAGAVSGADGHPGAVFAPGRGAGADFVGLPFSVRTLQPLLENLDKGVEEAAAILGAGRLRTFVSVIAPTLAAGGADGLWPGVRARPGRIRLDRFHFRQFAVPNRNRPDPGGDPIGERGFDYPGPSGWPGAAGLFLRAAVHPQLAARLVLQVSTAMNLPRSPTPASRHHRRCPRLHPGAPVVKWLLIGVAGLFAAVFLLLPLINIFAQAFSSGLAGYWGTLKDPDTVAAIRLTLLVAAISVPLNVVFGVAAAWAIAKFEFRGKAILSDVH